MYQDNNEQKTVGKNRSIRNINNSTIKDENNRAGILNPITTPIPGSKDDFLDNMDEAPVGIPIQQNQNVLPQNTLNKNISVNNQANINNNMLNANPAINKPTSNMPYTGNQMISHPQQTSSRIQLQPNQPIQNYNINNRNNIQAVRVYQPVPIQSFPMLSNQIVPLNAIIVQPYSIAIPSIGTYEPTNMPCPYCRINVTTVVDTDFNCGICCCMCWMTYFCLWWTFLFKICTGEDCCCYNAVHRCPNCQRVIASHIAKIW